jgi:hypothetical protein
MKELKLTAERFNEIIISLKSVRGKLFKTLGIDPNELS